LESRDYAAADVARDLAREPQDPPSIGSELDRIRGELRRLAAQNEEIRARLSPILGTRVPEDQA
jgi:hypothetical protein